MNRFPLLMVLALALGSPAAASPLPSLADALGWKADAFPEGNLLRAVFHPADWPGIHWKAGAPWAWGRGALVFEAENPGAEVLHLGLRVDDSPWADGVNHCRTATFDLGPGEVRRFVFDLGSEDPLTVHGMRGAPPVAGREGLTPLPGRGTIDPNHVTEAQFFLHNPPRDQTLVLRHWELLPPRDTSEDYRGIVDAWGQSTRTDWPGKFHGEWAGRRTAEEADLAAHPALADRDPYGGWASGPLLEATGFFRTAERDGRWWLVTPEGRLFLSFGVDVVRRDGSTLVGPRASLFADLPSPSGPLGRYWGSVSSTLYGPFKTGTTFDFYSANLERKYGPGAADAWKQTALRRLVSWGFNTVGNWSDEAVASRAQGGKVPYVATLDVWGDFARVVSGSDYWGKMPDPFDPKFIAAARARFAAGAGKFRDDPWCIGVFVDNELSWTGGPGDGTLGLAFGTLAAGRDQPAKKALVTQLQGRYADLEALNRAWSTRLSSWDDLKITQAAPNPAQKADLEAFVEAYARQYFSIVKRALAEVAPHQLYLGCRFAGTPPMFAVRAAAEACDVVSFNVYQRTLDPASWGFTSSLGKPCLIGEFHFGALDRGLFHPGLVPVADQADRAEAFARYIRSVADLPAFVGAHWFQYTDEPTAGRTLDGENYQIGFVSVTDQPYPEMVASARSVLDEVYRRHSR